MVAKKNKKIKINKYRNNQDLNVFNDLIAIVCLAFSILLGISILTPESSGVFGKFALFTISSVFGLGMYILPLGMLGLSIIFFIDKFTSLKISIFSSFISFSAILSIISIHKNQGNFFDLEFMKESGGLIGSLIAYPSYTLFGDIGAYIFLSALLFAGLVMVFNKPLRELISSRQESSKVKKAMRSVERPELTQPIGFGHDSFYQEEKLQSQVKTEKLKEEVETEVAANIQAEPRVSVSSTYTFPPIELLQRSKGKFAKTARELKVILENTLREFNVPANVQSIQEGPTVTTFELRLEAGTKVNRLLSLNDDIALALATPNIRILAPIPGKQAIGIEVPNIVRELVTLGDLLSTPEWSENTDPLLVAIGKDISGKPFYFSLKDMPHMLIAGSTGSGKSVALNSLINSILYRASPDEVKFILIDPKRVELVNYNDIPHLITPVITNPKMASSALAFIVSEMERRFEQLTKIPVRNIESYNQKALSQGLEKMPYLIVVIDELADLMIVSANEVEDAIVRISQLARAVGIHLVVATQRPSVDVITGLIKSNITTRVAFSVSSQVDSRVIIDSPGAEKLIGKGDMLFMTQSLLKPIRLQSPYMSEEEVEKVTQFVKQQRKPDYNEEILKLDRLQAKGFETEDDLFDEAVEIVIQTGQASVSYLQRKLRIGYARAARLMDMLEERGIVSPPDGARPRMVLITYEEWQETKTAKSE